MCAELFLDLAAAGMHVLQASHWSPLKLNLDTDLIGHAYPTIHVLFESFVKSVKRKRIVCQLDHREIDLND